ncbi:GNAT family N-acetyltransferase [Methylibium rhizosphaerae]|uniref:GNAT family N-acetyltransferase n=1 Tax=Methylibium rhizosphaerae TaxID=2570323 RepID=UPI0011282EC4|nr:GNAT family N-acetyltransferase [Methylibium rhizosphaerae]
MSLELSPLEHARFGFVTARGELAPEASIDAVLQRAHELGAEVVMLRVPTSNLRGAQQALAEGAILADTLVYYEAAVGDPAPVTLAAGLHHRMLGPQDAQEVETLARAAFRDYVGHYHADDRLSREAADETYASWASRSCEGPPVADAVIGVEDNDGSIVGFITLRRAGELASIELNAVSPDHQRRGIYAGLVGLSMNWASQQGCRKVSVSTQLNNVSVQKVWCRFGFEPARSYYTLHLWIPAPRS